MSPNPLAKVTLAIPCAQCGKHTQKPLSQLVGKSAITCSRCDARVDINSKYWRETIRKAVEDAQKTKPQTPG